MNEAKAPVAWPTAPSKYSFSALQALGECPRRWAYSNAHFTPGGLADHRGRLVRRPSWSALRGDVVHGVLEALLKVHRREAGPPPGSWALVSFWQRHLTEGGTGAMVAAEAVKAIGEATEGLRGRALRVSLLSRAKGEEAALTASVNWKLQFALGSAEPTQGARPAGGFKVLSRGATPEVRLECTLGEGVAARAWVGDVDVVRCAGDEVELLDYKTGEAKESHADQLRLYALLLARDRRFNPRGALATRLRLIYESGQTREVDAPAADELRGLEADTTKACLAAENALRVAPPPARVGKACDWCDGRPLCDVYWRDPAGAVAKGRARRVDLEATVSSVNADRRELGLAIGEASVRCLVRDPALSAVEGLNPGDRVRILGARNVTAPTEAGAQASGEVFEVDAEAEVVRCSATKGP